MFDERGVWQKQRVSKGVTMSGILGLFTGGFLVRPLTPEQYADDHVCEVLAQKMDMIFEPRKPH